MIGKAKTIVRRTLQELAVRVYPRTNFTNGVSCRELGNDGHFFVGYYDIDPVSTDKKSILCHRVSNYYSSSIEPETGEVGLVSVSSGQFSPLSTTRALNWQLGSRVQWLDDQTIIYNNVIDGIQCAQARNLNGDVSNYKRPFWAISPDKQIAASLNFSRIKEKRPGYGYKGVSPDGDKEILTLYRTEDDEVLYQVELDEALGQIGYELPGNVDPYLNHVTWSTCSTKFLTLVHYDDPVSKKRTIFPILLDCNDYSLSPFHSEGVFSHHVWLDHKRLLGFIEVEGEVSFTLWEQGKGWEKLENSMPVYDGHPSIIASNDDRIIVDSYPDRLGRMSLYVGSSNPSNTLRHLGVIMNDPKYNGPLRCDLHPRFSNKTNWVICDAPYTEGRRVLIMEGILDEQ